MEWIMRKSDILPLIKKYRYSAAVILVGIVLLLLPIQDRQDEQNLAEEKPENTVTFQNELESLLSQINGAGCVKVLLAESAGKETVYQMDAYSGSSDYRKDTVLITNAEREEGGLVVRIDPPVYQGAIVLCQGADQASIRLSIVEAVSSVTGLTSDRITVLKMK